MKEHVAGIVVGVDTLQASRTAIDWGVAEAVARNVPLQLLHAIRSQPLPEPAILAGAPIWGAEIPMETLREGADEIVEHALGYARSLAPDLEITTEVRQGDAAYTLIQAAHDHRLIVIGSRCLGAVRANLFGSVGTTLTHTSPSGFVVVRGRDQVERDAPVVVGVEPKATGERVLAVAFEQASLHRRRLRAVFGWEHDYYAPEDRTLTSVQEVRASAELWLAEAVAGWQEAYPDVAVERHLTFDYPTSALVAESTSAALVVIGGGRRRMGRRLGSVAAGVLHHAACPVEVVPQ